MVENVTNQNLGNRIVRPTTPPLEIPNHKIINPSEGKTDLMLLPAVSVFQREQIDKFLDNLNTTKSEA